MPGKLPTMPEEGEHNRVTAKATRKPPEIAKRPPSNLDRLGTMPDDLPAVPQGFNRPDE